MKRTNTMKNRKDGNVAVGVESAEEEWLSEHFTLAEMLRSGTAIRYNIENNPTERDIENLRSLCRTVLEPLRRRYGRIIITSGFRCPELNARVGGSPQSQHMRGEAVDIHVSCPEIAQKFAQFIISFTDFDQLIFEPAVAGGNKRPHWLHVSHTTRRRNRHQVV